MMTFNNNKATKRFYDELLATKERINVEPGKCRYNFRCQMNAAHEAMENKHESIALVVYLNYGKVDPIIHFINYHEGKYVDNTLGQWSKEHEYYLIRHIPKEDFTNVEFLFGAYRRSIRNNFGWWLRLTSNVTF